MIPFKMNMGNTAIIISLVYSLYFRHRTGLKFDKTKYYIIYFPLGFFLINLISALLSRNLHDGIKSIDKNLLVIIIPLTLFFLNKTNDFLKQTLTVFAASCSIATFILLIYGGYNILIGESMDVLFFHKFSIIYDQHAVYFALYLALSIFSLTHYYNKINLLSPQNKFLLLISLLLLTIGLFLTASKAMIFIFLILYFFQLFSILKVMKSRILVFLSFIFILLILSNTKVIKTRFIEGLEFNINNFQATNNLANAKVFNYQDKVAISDLELRYIFLKIGMFHFIDDGKFFFGYGVGDVQDYLDYYYLTYGLAPNWYEGFNIHNQYLQILITYGVFVFLFFLGYIVISFHYAIKQQSLLHLFFLIIISFMFIFEVPLVRNKGIVFFYFFNTLFFLNHIRFENSHFRN
jgi:O-antigen ligase